MEASFLRRRSALSFRVRVTRFAAASLKQAYRLRPRRAPWRGAVSRCFAACSTFCPRDAATGVSLARAAITAHPRRARRFISRARVMRERRRFTPRPRLRAPCRRFGLASCARRSPLRFQNFPYFTRFAVNRAAFPRFALALLKRSAFSAFFSRKIFSPLDYFDALATISVIYHRVIRQTSQILQEGRRAG